MKINFKQFDLDCAISFVKKVDKTIVYLVVYVNDLFIIGNNERYTALVKGELKKEF